MTKTVLPAVALALSTTLALPALAQTNPSIEGYEGGHVQAATAFNTADVVPSFDTNGTQLSNNQSLEGYNGHGTLNANAALDTLVVDRSQYASNPAIQDDAGLEAARQAHDDFAEMEERVLYRGR